ncbi:hypothetical protein Tco_0927251 [Tanacetum coccineum]
MIMQLHNPDYVPEPIYPEYIPLEDEHEFPAKEQPLSPIVSPTAESPGYVVESDPEEDPEEYEDDETEDGPVDYPMDGGEDEDDDDVDSAKAVPEIAPMIVGEINTRVTELAELHEHDTQDLYALLSICTRVSAPCTSDTATTVEYTYSDTTPGIDGRDSPCNGDMRRDMGDMHAELLALNSAPTREEADLHSERKAREHASSKQPWRTHNNPSRTDMSPGRSTIWGRAKRSHTVDLCPMSPQVPFSHREMRRVLRNSHNETTVALLPVTSMGNEFLARHSRETCSPNLKNRIREMELYKAGVYNAVGNIRAERKCIEGPGRLNVVTQTTEKEHPDQAIEFKFASGGDQKSYTCILNAEASGFESTGGHKGLSQVGKVRIRLELPQGLE